jgi:MoaA/NifB/PqqE/SkfB family radical SAM enzyme
MAGSEPDRSWAVAYDRTRTTGHQPFRSACYAPFVSMYLDVHGNVLACCQNTTQRLGNITRTPLIEIWRGQAAAELRAALIDYDLDHGCHFCHWQVDDSNNDGMFATVFDQYTATDADPEWPSRMEFSLSNTCNLECVMCQGEFSSAIRARREKLPPLPNPYGDAFFAQLEPFLPHLVEARFFGGEPFLATESFRIWDLMIEAGLETPCSVTTNGTILTPRVERVLERLPFSIGISIDGTTRDTVEAIRVNASFDQIMANFRRFHAYAHAKGTSLDLTFCLMRKNWQEFADYLSFADDWGCGVFVNTVLYPSEHSLYSLPDPELDEVLRRLEDDDARNRARLGRNLHVWDEEVARLRHWRDRLDRRAEGRGVLTTGWERSRLFFESADAAGGAEPTPGLLGADAARPGGVDEAKGLLERTGHGGVGAIRCDATGQVVESDAQFVGLPGPSCLGLSFNEVLGQLFARYGKEVGLLDEAHTDGVHERISSFRGTDGASTYVRSFTFRDPEDAHSVVHVGGVVPQPDRGQRVEVRRDGSGAV